MQFQAYLHINLRNIILQVLCAPAPQRRNAPTVARLGTEVRCTDSGKPVNFILEFVSHVSTACYRNVHLNSAPDRPEDCHAAW
jgi:hypothetical protein